MKAVLLSGFVLMLCACSSMSSRSDFNDSAAYQKRKTLTKSLTLTEGTNLSDSEIQNLLSSKVDLKRPLKIAVVKTDNLTSDRQAIAPLATPESANAVKQIIAKSKYIKDISFVPKFLMPDDLSVRNLRDVAAVMQADLLMILFPRTDTDSKFKFIGPNRAQAATTLEAVLVDVKTGAIPFTSIATGSAEIEKDEVKDFSEDTFRLRAISMAEDKAFSLLTEDLLAYMH